MRPPRLTAILLLLGGVVAASLHATEGGESKPLPARPSATSWRGLVGGGRPQVALGERMIVILRSPSLAERVQAAGGQASDAQEQRWVADALSAQQRVVLQLSTKGIFVRPEFRYARVVNGFSAALDPSAIAALERRRDVVGVYRVRAAFPATDSGAALAAAARGARLNRIRSSFLGLDGSGVLVALLDTGVDSYAPYLHGHVLPGIDVAGRGIDARPQASPGGSSERHGTEMAGIVVGAGRDGVSGVAPGATVLPVRVGGWQRDTAGRWSLHARSDQVLAGLERAVDPDGNGDAHDGARIALVPFVEPFAAFPDEPLAQAAAGAAALDTLVVTAAGNDGAAGQAFGSLSGPAGAPAALSVGAADLRSGALESRLVVRDGLKVLLNRDVPVLGTTGTSRTVSTRLAVAPGAAGSPRLFDKRGLSLVADQAALLPAGDAPTSAALAAVRAGATLVLLSGDTLPAGALGNGDVLGAPVLGVPSSLLAEARAAAAAGGRLELSIAPAHPAENDESGLVAAFSSRGLAYGGNVKPEVVGPGVGVVTVDPGARVDGTSQFVVVNGASAAAAVVAGQAAVVVEARPSLDALGLKAALVGTARGLSGVPMAAQGMGIPDVGAAASVEVVADPATLAFGRAVGTPWGATRSFTLRNVSTRPVRVYLSATGGRPGLAVDVQPRKLVLGAGGSTSVGAGVRITRPGAADVATGTLVIAPSEGTALEIPWSVVLRSAGTGLIGTVRLSAKRFKASDVTPGILLVQLGHVDVTGDGVQVEPLSHFDLRLTNRKGKDLGLLTRLRDVVPGSYAFGITGRGPHGVRLPAGTYRLRLLAFPTAGGPAVVRSVVFAVR